MRNLVVTSLLAVGISLSVGASAQASLLFSSTTPTGDTALPGSYSYSVLAPSATSAIASFELQSYNSLDGQNFYEDDFTLSQNGMAIFKGTFDLGGGGANVVYFAPAGSTYNVTPVSTGNPTFAGGIADITVPVLLGSGSTIFTLSYDSLPSPGHAGYQGIGDEGFGINSFQVASVPLPASLPMFAAALLGLGAVGYGLTRTKATRAI